MNLNNKTMKTLVKLIALIVLIIASILITHKGFSNTVTETDVNEPQDMAKLEMVETLNKAYFEMFENTNFINKFSEPDILIFDFMDNLILEGNSNDRLIKSLLRCCDLLTETSGTKLYKMTVEKPIYKECKKLLDLK